ncbi:hypothetical protein [Leifsonia shinshuensis]|uniref:hypothetical protein n=1 Tax=Leifsonia shinshuensis TaxID=150026 RepID=UPI002859FCBD|nr:hypothetical protein [Leifsonia shinshuensis]MDR6970839.1 hypothetical protein [Leifsonia shinshuensis]
MWKLYIGGVLVGNATTHAAMERMTQTFREIIASGGGWHDLQYPLGDGIGTNRIFLNAASQILFLEAD